MITSHKFLSSSLGALVGIFGFLSADSTQADLIGDITFLGGIQFNGDASTASSVDAAGGFVLGGTGDYSGISLGTSVAMNGFDFSSSLGGNSYAINPDPTTVWSVVSGGVTYDFLLESPLTIDRFSNSIRISGEGLARRDGTEDTLGAFSMVAYSYSSADRSHMVFLANSSVENAIAASSVSNIPDGGRTVTLLGASLLAVAFVGKGARSARRR